jgi:hypothetical protein
MRCLCAALNYCQPKYKERETRARKLPVRADPDSLGWHVANDGRPDRKSPAGRSGELLPYPRKIRTSACSTSAFTFQNGHKATWRLTLRIPRIPTKTVRNNNLLDCVSIGPVIGFDLPSVFHRVIISIKCLDWVLVVFQFDQFAIPEGSFSLSHHFAKRIENVTIDAIYRQQLWHSPFVITDSVDEGKMIIVTADVTKLPTKATN